MGCGCAGRNRVSPGSGSTFLMPKMRQLTIPFIILSSSMPEPEKKKLKIAISIFMFWPNTGGLQAHAELLCKYLRERGHEVCVVTRAASQPLKSRDFLFFNEKAS